MRFIVGTFLRDVGADRTGAPVIVCTERVWKSRAAGAKSETRSQTLQISFFIPVSASLIYDLTVIGPNVFPSAACAARPAPLISFSQSWRRLIRLKSSVKNSQVGGRARLIH